MHKAVHSEDCVPSRQRLVDCAAADDGAEHLSFCVLRWRNFGEVVRKDDEVGVFAGFQLTLLPFLELRVGRARSISTKAIVERDFLPRLPAVLRAAVGAFASNAGVEAAEGAGGLDGVIRAKRQSHTVL